jgi:DNA-binding NarL/FixJ family response regulator
MVRLIGRSARNHPSPAVADLSPPEREVLDLVAAGLSDAEIAPRLNLDAAAVGEHVQRVLGKLGARDRIHAVLAAPRAGGR